MTDTFTVVYLGVVALLMLAATLAMSALRHLGSDPPFGYSGFAEAWMATAVAAFFWPAVLVGGTLGGLWWLLDHAVAAIVRPYAHPAPDAEQMTDDEYEAARKLYAESLAEVEALLKCDS